MARPCTVCTHSKLAEIDEALVAGHSHRAVATAHGLGRWAVLRHRRNHLSEALRARFAERQSARQETLVDRLEELYDRIEGILDAAEEGGQPVPGLLAAREMRKCIELLGRFLGQVDSNALTVHGPVAFQVVHYGGLDPAAILRALDPWPEAQAVVRDLFAPTPAPPPAPVLDRPPLVPAPTSPAGPPVPTLARTGPQAAPGPMSPAWPPPMAGVDRDLLRRVEVQRRADALAQQVTEPQR